MSTPERVLLIDEARGIYVPSYFYHNFDFGEWNLKIDDYRELSSPDNEGYDDAWDELIASAVHYTDSTEYRLEMDEGNLFAVPTYHTDEYED